MFKTAAYVAAVLVLVSTSALAQGLLPRPASQSPGSSTAAPCVPADVSATHGKTIHIPTESPLVNTGRSVSGRGELASQLPS
jgi:hypothetical protein